MTPRGMKMVGRRMWMPLMAVALSWGCKAKQEAAVAPVAVVAPMPTVPVHVPQPVEFVLLQLNDVYEISPMDHGKVAGMARVLTVKRQLEAAGNRVVTVLSGDYLSPSLIGTLKCDFPEGKSKVNGRHMVDIMNAIGVDYVTFGNHEFDLKVADLQARNEESKFKIVSANVLQVKDGVTAPFQQHGQPVPPYLVQRFWNNNGDTLRLGLLGVTLPFNFQPYLTYTDIYGSAAKAYEAAMLESDVVMGITHLSAAQDDTLSRRLPGMPLLMGGHEHQNMLLEVGDAHIAKADANAKSVYLHWCSYDPASRKMKVFSQLMPITDAIVSDPDVERLANKWESFAEDCMRSQGYAPNDTIGYAFVPLDGRDGTMRTTQTNMGFLICDAMRTVDPAADVALMNSGSVRLDDRIEGLVLQRHILATLPFGGGILHGKMKGSDLVQLLDKGLSKELDMNGAHLQYSSNLSRTGSQFLLNGKALDPNKLYMVAMPGFLTGMAPGTGETVYNSMGIAKMAEWVEPDLKVAMGKGLRMNDVRDITIYAMKQDPEFKMVLGLLRK